jgi:hypothetical protein
LESVRRWLPFASAALATVILAGGFGLAVGNVAMPSVQPAPQLRTVPASTLTRLGLTLSAPAQPLYCGLAGAASSRGWVQSGAAGCAIDRHAAEAAAQQGGSLVVESVFAFVTSTQDPAVGRNRLAWVVVAQQTPGACLPPATGGSSCPPGGRRPFTWSQVVLVDAHDAGVIIRKRLMPAGRAPGAFAPVSALGV